MGLDLDNTKLSYTSGDVNCTTEVSAVSIDAASAVANATLAPGLFIANEKLHSWDLSDGVIGMSYCLQGTCLQPTPFQNLVKNATESSDSSLVFGLDFRSKNAAANQYVAASTAGADSSAMQLGGVDAQYAESLLWTVQSTDNPLYHQFYVEDLLFCNSQILGNYSQNWQVEVDTGSVCLTLPSEIYDSFTAWFDNSTQIDDVASMPAFSYAVSNGVNTTNAYLPLGDLLINSSAIETEEGAPFVNVRYPTTTSDVQRMRLCVLRGGDIAHRVGGKTEYYTPAPQIVFGSLALQSIYFAADFQDVRVGVANKLSAAFIDGFSATNRVGCAAATVCIGDQEFRASSNSCKDPPCGHYFFTELDHDTKKCIYNHSNYVGGLVFIILIVIAEVVSYFVSQYSAHTALEQGRASSMDPLTKYVGWSLAYLVDFVVIHVLQWAPSRNANAAVAAANRPEEAVALHPQPVG